MIDFGNRIRDRELVKWRQVGMNWPLPLWGMCFYDRSLIAGSAQDNSKNICLKFWNIIGILKI